MTILSQNRQLLLTITEMFMQVEKVGGETETIPIKYYITQQYPKIKAILGEYETLNQAQEVLSEITESLQSGSKTYTMPTYTKPTN